MLRRGRSYLKQVSHPHSNNSILPQSADLFSHMFLNVRSQRAGREPFGCNSTHRHSPVGVIVSRGRLWWWYWPPFDRRDNRPFRFVRGFRSFLGVLRCGSQLTQQKRRAGWLPKLTGSRTRTRPTLQGFQRSEISSLVSQSCHRTSVRQCGQSVRIIGFFILRSPVE